MVVLLTGARLFHDYGVVGRCPILFVTGAKSIFCSSTRQLHQSVMRQAADKGKIDLLEISGCANVLQETVSAVAERHASGGRQGQD